MKTPKISHRIFSAIFDFFIMLALILIAMIPSVVSLINTFVNNTTINVVSLYLSTSISGALALVLIILYSIVVPVLLHGQTLGKKYFNLSIVKVNGQNIDFKSMFIRELTRLFAILASFGLVLIVDFITLVTSRGQTTFYDILASTNVVDVFGE